MFGGELDFGQSFDEEMLADRCRKPDSSRRAVNNDSGCNDIMQVALSASPVRHISTAAVRSPPRTPSSVIVSQMLGVTGMPASPPLRRQTSLHALSTTNGASQEDVYAEDYNDAVQSGNTGVLYGAEANVTHSPELPDCVVSQQRNYGAADFPGPAANILATPGCGLALVHEVSLGHCADEQEFDDDKTDQHSSDPTLNASYRRQVLLNSGAWRRMNDQFSQGSSALLNFNISVVKQLSGACRLQKVPFLVVFLHCLKPLSELTHSALFLDSSGVISGSICDTLVRSHQSVLRAGCVLVLREAALWRVSAVNVLLCVSQHSLAYVFADQPAASPTSVVKIRPFSDECVRSLETSLSHTLSNHAINLAQPDPDTAPNYNLQQTMLKAPQHQHSTPSNTPTKPAALARASEDGVTCADLEAIFCSEDESIFGGDI